VVDSQPKVPSWNDIRRASHNFVIDYANATDENAEAQSFMTDFLGLFGISRRRVNAVFEDRSTRSSTGGLGRIDMFWPSMLAVEMKSAGKNLTEAEAQCFDYLHGKSDFEWPKAILTSNFTHLRVTHLDDDRRTVEFPLAELTQHVEEFAFLIGQEQRAWGTIEEQEATIKAAQLMGVLYEQVAKTGYDDHETSILLTRLLFLMFGDDTGLWERNLFAEFIAMRTSSDGSDLGGQLAHLFQVLDRPADKRLGNTDEILMRFPYVNGGLFTDLLLLYRPHLTVRGHELKQPTAGLLFQISNLTGF